MSRISTGLVQSHILYISKPWTPLEPFNYNHLAQMNAADMQKKAELVNQ